MEKKLTASGGIPVYYYENEHLHSICICVYFKAGLLYEKRENAGITHLWEHMAFKNINACVKGKLSKKLDKMGAYFNGCTYKEVVELKISASSRYFRECSDLITKVFEDYCFSDKDLEIEKKRIKSEIREENEKKSIDYLAGKRVWKNTVLQNSLAGDSKVLDYISKKKLTKFHDQMRNSDNIFVYVTGNVTDDDIEYLADKISSYDIKSTEENKRECIAPVPKKMFNRDAAVDVVKADVNEIRFSLDINREKCSVAELDLLYDILFNGESCKIFEGLSDKTGLIYSYDSALELYNNVGNMYFSYQVKEKRILESIERVILIFKKLRDGVDKELKYVKQPYIDSVDVQLDDPDGLNRMMAFENHILDQGYESLTHRKEVYESVTPERMLKVIKKVLSKDNLCITIKTTNGKLKASDVYKIARKL